MRIEHASVPVTQLAQALRVWRRCAGTRELIVPGYGEVAMRYFTEPSPVQIHHAAVWALVHDRARELSSAIRQGAVIRDSLDFIPELAVLADELQAAGDPLGLVIATEIANKRESDETDSYTRSLAAMVHVAALAHDVSLDPRWIVDRCNRRQGTEIADRIAAVKTRAAIAAQQIFAGESDTLRTLDANEWTVAMSFTNDVRRNADELRFTLTCPPVREITLSGGDIGDVVECEIVIRNGKLHRLELSTRAG